MKPGYLTTEFYLTTITILLGQLYASGIVTSGSTADKIIGFAASALAVLGYTVSRGMAKKGAIPMSAGNVQNTVIHDQMHELVEIPTNPKMPTPPPTTTLPGAP